MTRASPSESRDTAGASRNTFLMTRMQKTERKSADALLWNSSGHSKNDRGLYINNPPRAPVPF
eukprot:scaffold4957_cov111-Cylindrotheca_fusiformis.AAC.2